MKMTIMGINKMTDRVSVINRTVFVSLKFLINLNDFMITLRSYKVAILHYFYFFNVLKNPVIL